MPDSTYAPQSPDLSSFFSASPTKQLHPQQHQQPHTQTSAGSYAPQHTSGPAGYAPRSPNLAALEQFSPTLQHQPQPFGFSGGYQAPVPSNPYNQGGFGPTDHGSRREEAYLPPIPDLPLSHVEGLQSPVRNTFQHHGQYQQTPYPEQEQRQDSYGYPSQPAPQSISQSQYDHELGPKFDFDYSQSQPQSHNFLQSPTSYNNPIPTDFSHPSHTSNTMSASRAGGRAKQEAVGSIKQENGLGPSMGIDVKTKFPVARIKRIMQADEEVGKVAQVTPVAVSKALELFMISLVTKSSDLARQSNSKRVTAQHLKKAIESDVQFDFLGEIVSKVVEGPDAGGKRVKDDDSSGDEAPREKKKRGGGGGGRGGRKKSGAD